MRPQDLLERVGRVQLAVDPSRVHHAADQDVELPGHVVVGRVALFVRLDHGLAVLEDDLAVLHDHVGLDVQEHVQEPVGPPALLDLQVQHEGLAALVHVQRRLAQADDVRPGRDDVVVRAVDGGRVVEEELIVVVVELHIEVHCQ